MERIIPHTETLIVEFKSDQKKLADSELFEAVVAFANTDGGALYLGVEDDGTITGINEAHKNPVTLNALIANNTVPPIPVRVEIIDEIYPVLKITVPKSHGGIVATNSGKILRRQIKLDGKPENIPMYPIEITTRLSDLRMLDYSAMALVNTTIDDFDPLEVERLRQLILAYNGDKSLLELPDNDLFKALGLVKEQNGLLTPTVTGLLMIGKTNSLKQHIPTHASAFQVLEGTNVRVNDDFILPILVSVEKLNNYIEAWNPEQELEMGLFRIQVPEFDKRAIREAVINAYSHRDYAKMGRVRIALSDDGLTIANPGGFVEGVTIKNLLTAEPHGRNPLLADVLKRVGLAERTGRGIDRIFEGSLIYGRQLPDYSASTAVTVSLSIPRSPLDPQITKLFLEEQNRLGRPLSLYTLLVLNGLKNLPRSDVHQLAETIDVPESVIKSVLDISTASGIVEAYGNGRGRTYMLSHKFYSEDKKNLGYVRLKDIDDARHIELVISLAETHPFISRADVINLLHISTGSAYAILKKLVNNGIIEPINKGRYAKYKLKKNYPTHF